MKLNAVQINTIFILLYLHENDLTYNETYNAETKSRPKCQESQNPVRTMLDKTVMGQTENTFAMPWLDCQPNHHPVTSKHTFKYILERSKACKALTGSPMTELRDVAYHMGSHSVICYQTQVNALHPNPRQQLVLALPTQEGWEVKLT